MSLQARHLLFSIKKRSAPIVLGVVPTPEAHTVASGAPSGGATVESSSAAHSGVSKSGAAVSTGKNGSTATDESGAVRNRRADGSIDSPVGSASDTAGHTTSTASHQGAKTSTVSPVGTDSSSKETENGTASSAASKGRTSKIHGSTAETETGLGGTGSEGSSTASNHGSTSSTVKTETAAASSGAPKGRTAKVHGSSTSFAKTETGDAGSEESKTSTSKKSGAATSTAKASDGRSPSTGALKISTVGTGDSTANAARGRTDTASTGAPKTSSTATTTRSTGISTDRRSATPAGEHQGHPASTSGSSDRALKINSGTGSVREYEHSSARTAGSASSTAKGKAVTASIKKVKGNILSIGAIPHATGGGKSLTATAWDADTGTASSMGTPDASQPAAEVKGAPTPAERRATQAPVPGVPTTPTGAFEAAMPPLAAESHPPTHKKTGLWSAIWRWAKPGKKHASEVQSSGTAGAALPQAPVATGAPAGLPEAGRKQAAGPEAIPEAAAASSLRQKDVLSASEDVDKPILKKGVDGISDTQTLSAIPGESRTLHRVSQTGEDETAIEESTRGPGSKAKEASSVVERSRTEGTGLSVDTTALGLLRLHPWGGYKAKAAKSVLLSKLSAADPPVQAIREDGALLSALMTSKDSKLGLFNKGVPEKTHDGPTLSAGLPEVATATDHSGKSVVTEGGAKKAALEAVALGALPKQATPSALLAKAAGTGVEKKALEVSDLKVASQTGLGPAVPAKKPAGKKTFVEESGTKIMPEASSAALKDGDDGHTVSGRDIKARGGKGLFRKEKKKRNKKKAAKLALASDKVAKKSKKKSTGKGKKGKGTATNSTSASEKGGKVSRRQVA